MILILNLDNQTTAAVIALNPEAPPLHVIQHVNKITFNSPSFIHCQQHAAKSQKVYFWHQWVGWSKVQGIFRDLHVDKHAIKQYCLSMTVQKVRWFKNVLTDSWGGKTVNTKGHAEDIHKLCRKSDTLETSAVKVKKCVRKQKHLWRLAWFYGCTLNLYLFWQTKPSGTCMVGDDKIH